jgi:hypothetical protein
LKQVFRKEWGLIKKISMIILQAGIALGLLLLIMLVILGVLSIYVVFIRSDNQIISLIEKGIKPSLKQKTDIILKNLFYYLVFVLPFLAIIYWFLKDVIIL